jgi:hypothetical protein
MIRRMVGIIGRSESEEDEDVLNRQVQNLEVLASDTIPTVHHHP